jgi:HlyD family secretion protein
LFNKHLIVVDHVIKLKYKTNIFFGKVVTMRIKKIIVAVFVVGLLAVALAGCTRSNNTTTTTTIRDVKVTLGTVTNDVTGTASLALAKTENIAFTASGTVDSVAVALYDTVTQGETLAKLDTTDWDTQIQTLTKSITTAQRNETAKETAVVKAQNNVAAAQFAKTQRDVDLLSAQAALGDISEVQTAQNAIDSIQQDINAAQYNQQQAATRGNVDDLNYWTSQLKLLNAELAVAKANYKTVVSGTSVNITSDINLQITKAQLAVQSAQNAVDNAVSAINDANTAVANAQLDVADAKSAISDIQSQIDEIKNYNPLITAPFDGFITAVNVKGGDSILKGKVAFTIADPNQFEANFMVSETDIFSVKVGQTATVSVDALSGQSFPAKITAIAPLATTTQGVVNYQVTAEITSLIPISSSSGSAAFGQSGSNTPATGTTTPAAGSTPSASRTPPAGFTPSASFTPPAGFTPGASFTPPAGFTPGAGRTRPAGAGSATSGTPVTLKQGLTASVSIVIQQKSNVLVVPNRAITTQLGKTTVQLVNGTSVTTQAVTTGLSDSTNTEIVSGLTEGQTVQVKSSTSSSTGGFGPGGGVQGIRLP